MIVRIVRFADERRVCITDRNQVVLSEEDAPDSVLEDMNGDAIAYFHAHKDGDKWRIGARVKDQEW